MGTDSIPALRGKPGESFLAAETVQIGLRFDADGEVYEVVTAHAGLVS